MTALRENPLGHAVAQYGGVHPLTPPRQRCRNNGPRPDWLPPREFHCGQDHYLQNKYGITCDDWWEMYERQGGRCGVCRRLPRTRRRMVVDHDHDTGEIEGLAEFGCNRPISQKLRRYVKNPPARGMGLKVPPAKLRAIRADDAAKRKRDQDRTRPRTNNGPDQTGDFHARTRAALEATKQGG